MFPHEDLLTWVTGSIETSFAPYTKQSPMFERIGVPTVVAQFPGEIVQAPAQLAEQSFDLDPAPAPPPGSPPSSAMSRFAGPDR